MATEDWTELDAKLPHVMFSHAAMFMKDPACPGASVQNNGEDIKCLGHDYYKMCMVTMVSYRKSYHVDGWTTLGKQRHRLEQSLDQQSRVHFTQTHM